MGVGRIISRGEHSVIFPKFFQGGGKSGETCFSHSKLKQNLFLLKISKSRVEPRPCPPSDAHGRHRRFRVAVAPNWIRHWFGYVVYVSRLCAFL